MTPGSTLDMDHPSTSQAAQLRHGHYRQEKRCTRNPVPISAATPEVVCQCSLEIDFVIPSRPVYIASKVEQKNAWVF